MSIRGFAYTIAAALLLGLMPGMAEATTVISSSVVLTITSPGTIYFGQSVDGYASVTTSDGSTPTGIITFYDGGQDICSIAVAQQGSCSADTGTGFAVGSHTITAVYSGDATHTGSTSNAVTVVVVQDVTTVSLTSSANPATVGQSLKLTAIVDDAYASPAGTVTFLDGGAVLGAAAVNSSGVATLSISSLSPGDHSVTASYSGNANTVASVSSPLMETVDSAVVTTGGEFSVAVTGSTTVGVGRTADLVVSVSSPQGVTPPAVQLSCSGLPWESACTFGVQTIPAGGGSTTLQVSTMAPHDCGSTTPYFLSAGMPFAGPMLAGLMILFVPGKKRRGWKGLLIALVAICGVTALTGCGTCTDLGTKPGSYTIKVIATAVGTDANTSPSSMVTTPVKITVSLQ
jgi:hypothetical protein